MCSSIFSCCARSRRERVMIVVPDNGQPVEGIVAAIGQDLIVQPVPQTEVMGVVILEDRADIQQLNEGNLALMSVPGSRNPFERDQDEGDSVTSVDSIRAIWGRSVR